MYALPLWHAVVHAGEHTGVHAVEHAVVDAVVYACWLVDDVPTLLLVCRFTCFLV